MHLPPGYALICTAFLIFTCQSIVAQSDTGKVVVSITDANGALISGATVHRTEFDRVDYA
jgi:hypothetical protein